MRTQSLSRIQQGVVNFADYIQGSTNVGLALEKAIADMLLIPNSALVIPPGEYTLNDKTTAYILSGNSHAIVCPYGQAILNFNNGPGFEFSNSNQDTWAFKNIAFKNCSAAIAVQDNTTGYSFLRTNIKVEGCDFTNTTTLANVKNIYLNCKVRNISVENCTFRDTTTSVSHMAISVGDRFDVDYSYGENDVANSAYGTITIHNNKFINLTSPSLITIDAYGWKITADLNKFDYVGSNSTPIIRMRSLSGNITNNIFNYSSGTSIIDILGGTGTYGSAGPILISKNIYKGVASLHVNIKTSDVKICDEIVESATGSHIFTVAASTVIDNVEVTNCTFNNCRSLSYVRLRGNNNSIKYCVINNPNTVSGAESFEHGGFYLLSSTSNVTSGNISDCVVNMKSTWEGTGLFNIASVYDPSVNTVTTKNIRVINNIINNTTAIASGNASVVSVTTRWPETTGWVIKDNLSVPNWFDNANHSNISSPAASTATPPDIIFESLFYNPIIFANNLTLKKSDSGAWISNDTAAAIRTVTLPPAVPGLKYKISKTSSHNILVNCAASNSFRGGATNGTLTVVGRGHVTVFCRTPGVWDVYDGVALFEIA